MTIVFGYYTNMKLVYMLIYSLCYSKTHIKMFANKARDCKDFLMYLTKVLHRKNNDSVIILNKLVKIMLQFYITCGNL